MLFSGGVWTWCKKCGQRLTAIGLCGLPVCDACEACERAAPPPPPPAVAAEQRPAQFHNDGEMNVHPSSLQPGTEVASGAILNAYPWSGAISYPAQMPEYYLVWSGGGLCWRYHPEPPPIYLSGSILQQLTPAPLWPPLRSGRAYG
jgi:hypothetical protein